MSGTLAIQHRAAQRSRVEVFYVVAPDGLCYWFGESRRETP
ncbi:MAG: hypothetical protein ACRD3G_09865 [Vicinamibacterales bacterium]